MGFVYVFCLRACFCWVELREMILYISNVTKIMKFS
jgi:hypothetical protein